MNNSIDQPSTIGQQRGAATPEALEGPWEVGDLLDDALGAEAQDEGTHANPPPVFPPFASLCLSLPADMSHGRPEKLSFDVLSQPAGRFREIHRLSRVAI